VPKRFHHSRGCFHLQLNIVEIREKDLYEQSISGRILIWQTKRII
jgi:hypothetical protein